MEQIRRFRKIINRIPNLISGYNIYVNREKFSLIDYVFTNLLTSADSFADLGGVWKVNAAYTRYVLDKYKINRGYLVDTNLSGRNRKKLAVYENLEIIEADFTNDSVLRRINRVHVVFLFDVLLHQANPDWGEVLEKYAGIADCLIIYNQQLISHHTTIRLTELPLEDYKKIVPQRRDDFYDIIYARDQELHPEYHKPWKDIHNIWQWGITDTDLRAKVQGLGFRLAFNQNYGRFADLPNFEDHAFVFLRETAK